MKTLHYPKKGDTMMSPNGIETNTSLFRPMHRHHQQNTEKPSSSTVDHHEKSPLLASSSYVGSNGNKMMMIGTPTSISTSTPTTIETETTSDHFIYSPMGTSPPLIVTRTMYNQKNRMKMEERKQRHHNEVPLKNIVNNNQQQQDDDDFPLSNRLIECNPNEIPSLQSYLSFNHKDQIDDNNNFIDIEANNDNINDRGSNIINSRTRERDAFVSLKNQSTITQLWNDDDDNNVDDELTETERKQLLMKNSTTKTSSSRRSNSSRRSMYSSYRSQQSYYYDPCGIIQICSRIDTNAFQFGIRMAIMLTICALFVLIHTKKNQYPDAMFILITTLFVCWFPSLDAASVIEKVVQRLIGTFIGAVLGLSCGFASIFVYDKEGDSRFEQSIFIGICFFIVNFFIVFLAGQVKVDGATVINRFNYATILCVLTFCICLLPFASDSNPKWKHGVWRIINVIVGCVLGAIGSIVIFPKSTNDLLFEKTSKQVRLAGEASEALLQTASDYFAGRVKLTKWAEDLVRQPLETTLSWKFKSSADSYSNDDSSIDIDVNVAMKKYEDAILDWRATKALFPMAQYDPFAIDISRHPGAIENLNGGHNYKGHKVHMEIARTLARALRIQTTIIVLDGMIRSDAPYDFTSEQLTLFASIGRLIREMLTVPLELHISNDAARQLFDKLQEIRTGVMIESSKLTEAREMMEQNYSQSIQYLKNVLLDDIKDEGHLINRHNKNSSFTNGKSPTKNRKSNHTKKSSSFNSLIVLDLGEDDADEEGRGIPKNATNQYENTLFFLQLVEHLILRSLRLYQAWKHVEVKLD